MFVVGRVEHGGDLLLYPLGESGMAFHAEEGHSEFYNKSKLLTQSSSNQGRMSSV